MESFSLYGLIETNKFIDNLAKSEIPYINKKEKLNGNKVNVEYVNLPAAFDIETSSFYMHKDKMACMYIWQLGINGRVIYGRTWEEFTYIINKIVDIIGLGLERRLIVFVHNLSYEFEWIKDRFKWVNIFAREKRSPMKALTANGIEFRCSYVLSGCSLEQTCKGLTKYKMNKKVGDLDYTLIRTPHTPISVKELDYCIYDVLGVMAYVQEMIEQYGDITKVPLTNTSKVRLYCRKKCYSKENAKNYFFLMNKLTLTGKREYDLLKRAFTAGFTHANYMKSNEVWENVVSKDFTSSYPSVMVCEKFPMSRGQWVKVSSIYQIENMSQKDYYCIFNIRLHNVKEVPGIPDHYLSLSKCKGCVNYKTDNGRLISADQLETTITSDDWDIIKKVYTFDNKKVEIGKCIRYRLGYLPKVFVQCVLDFYMKKTTLKDVVGMESEYSLFKGNLNSTFGMCITDIVSEEIAYNDEWISENGDSDESIAEYNKSKNRFLFYPWGIAICSKARRNLWSAILELGQDYIYSDTDSVKYINAEKHEEYFRKYNEDITNKMRTACKVQGLNFEETQPKTVKGVTKPLGVWDDDGKYKRFKTLGAKRYLTEDYDGHIKSTIAGASKKDAGAYIADQADPFEFFADKMKIDKEHSGRLIHTYIDHAYTFTVTDYLGQEYTGSEKSGIHMEASEYNLTLTPFYSKLLSERETRIL